METVVKISSKYQVVIPRRVRKVIKVQPGDQLLVQAQNGMILMRVKPRNYAKYLRGLHKEVWKEISAENYVRQERKSWH